MKCYGNGCAAAFDGQDGRQKLTVVDIDGDGSFMMNPQELATLTAHNLDVKIMVLNNQHLGMNHWVRFVEEGGIGTMGVG